MNQFNEASIAATSHSTEQVIQAQHFFKLFSESTTVLEDCRCILEQGSSLSQFHAARLLGEAAVVRWTQLNAASQKALRDYLFQWVCQRSNITGDPVARAARTTAAKAFAVLTKRSWLELPKLEIHNLLLKFEDLSSNPNHRANHLLQSTVAELLLALMNEFSSTKSTGVGLPKEWHSQCHNSFENHGLPVLLRCAFDRVVALVGQGSAQHNNPRHSQCVQWLTLVEEMFGWFGSSGGSSGSSSSSSSSNTSRVGEGGGGGRNIVIKLDHKGHDMFVRLDVIHCLFKARSQAFIDQVTFGDSQLLTRVNSILIHFGSISGSSNGTGGCNQCGIFVHSQERYMYAHAIMQSTLIAAQQISNQQNEELSESTHINMLFVGTLVQRLVHNFGPKMLILNTLANQNHSTGSGAAIQTMGQLCSRYLSTAVNVAVNRVEQHHEPPDPLDASMEAFECLLEMWVAVVKAAKAEHENTGNNVHGRNTAVAPESVQVVAQCSSNVYNTMVQGRLHVATSVILYEINDDDEFEDVTLLNEQMNCAAVVGRADPSQSLLLLTNLIQTKLHGLAMVRNNQSATSNELGASCPPNVDQIKQSHILLDQLWWLIHFLGHLLVDRNKGEIPMVPTELNALSFQAMQQQGLPQKCSSTSSSSFLDPIVKACNALFDCINHECTRVESRATGGSVVSSGATNTPVLSTISDPSLSPLFHEKLLWFLQRWSRAYLMPDATLYRNTGLCPSLVAQYGSNTNRGQQTVGYFLSKATLLLCYWPNEPGVVSASLDLLKTLCSHRCMRRSVVSQPAFATLLRAYSNCICPTMNNAVPEPDQLTRWMTNGIGNMTPSAVGTLSQVICLACDASDTPDILQANLRQAAAPAFTRLQQITSNSALDHQNPLVRDELCKLLEVLRGIAESTSMTNLNILFDMCAPTLQGVVNLLHVYHHSDSNVVKACLEYFTHLVEHQIVHLDPIRSRLLYTHVGQLLDVYMQHGLGASWIDLTRTIEGSGVTMEADDVADEILLVLRIMSQFANKKLADWYDVVDDASALAAKEASDTIDNAILVGLRMVVPNISPKVMRFPKVCQEYFRFVSFACEGYPHQMMNLGEHVSSGILATIRFGLQHHNTVIVRQALRSIQEMSEYCAKQNGLVVARTARKLPPGAVPKPVNSPVLQDWLHLLIELILKENQHIADVLGDSAGTLLTLIICEQPTYMRLAQSVVQAHPHESTKTNVANAFQTLISANGVKNNKIDRNNRRLFRKNVLHFVEIMRGLGVK